MGSIMGGLYAIGYTANELDSIINALDWNSMLSDKIPLSLVVPEEKHDYNRFLFQFDLTKRGPVLPAGVVAGQGIAEEMNYLTWYTTEFDSFDDFPIPFRCVASDLISGKPYVFKSGSLSTAMRASMAIPSIFSPVVLDSMLLVDGGVLDNIPVRTCREMGADIIITVNVGFRSKPKIEDFKSIGDILMGAAMIRSNYHIKESLAHTDILIAPDLSNYSAGSFFNGKQIIELGEIAARKKYNELANLANFMHQFPKEKKEKNTVHFLKRIYIEDIRVENLKKLSKQFTLGKFGLKKGYMYTKDEIDGGLHKLIGTRYIQNVNYTLKLGKHGYILTLIPTETFSSKYNFSTHYDNTYKSSAIFNLSLRNYLFKGSRFSASFELSEYPRLNTEYIDYIGASQMAGTFIKSQLESNLISYFKDDGTRLGGINNNYTNFEAGVLYSLDTKRAFRASLFYQRQISNSGNGILDLIIEGVNKIGIHWWGIKFNYNKNSLNEQFLPTKGFLFDLDIEYPIGINTIYSGSDSSLINLEQLVDIPAKNYIRLKTKLSHYIPISSKLNLAFAASLGGATSKMSNFQYFNFGGIKATARTKDIPFIGLSTREITAQQFVLARLDFRYEPFNNFFITLSANALDYNSNFKQLSFTQTKTLSTENIIIGGGILLSYNSILGPLELGYSKCTLHDKNRWYITAGFPF